MKTLVAVLVAIAVSLGSIGVVSAEFSEAEQKAIRGEASTFAQKSGFPEEDAYRVHVLMYLATKSLNKAYSTKNPVEAEHEKLRANVYTYAANASLKVVWVLKRAQELLVDLKAEQVAGRTAVSPELSRRINSLGIGGVDAIGEAARMSNAMVALTSFEATQGCNTEKFGYTMHCLKTLQDGVEDIETAIAVLQQAMQPFSAIAVLGISKHFMY